MSPNRFSLIALFCAAALTAPAFAQSESAEKLVDRISQQVLGQAKADSKLRQGDMARIQKLVDEVILPNVNFQRMTASAVGSAWRSASDAQKASLQAEFKMLLIRTYAGALSLVKDQIVALKPSRNEAGANDIIIRTELKGEGEPVQLDYRLENKSSKGERWLIYDVNILGIWLVQNYRTSFAEEISKGGLDGLIASLNARNKKGIEKKPGGGK